MLRIFYVCTSQVDNSTGLWEIQGVKAFDVGSAASLAQHVERCWKSCMVRYWSTSPRESHGYTNCKGWVAQVCQDVVYLQLDSVFAYMVCSPKSHRHSIAQPAFKWPRELCRCWKFPLRRGYTNDAYAFWNAVAVSVAGLLSVCIGSIIGPEPCLLCLANPGNVYGTPYRIHHNFAQTLYAYWLCKYIDIIVYMYVCTYHMFSCIHMLCEFCRHIDWEAEIIQNIGRQLVRWIDTRNEQTV